jgi:adenosylmethionine-8-amino-7-oxononanoate aminotransferase
VVDTEGRRYLDAAGGAIVCGVGHGRTEIARAMAAQVERLEYVHGATFTTPVLEGYARRLAPHLPLDEPRVFPVSGGSEATETAIKLVLAYHAARGEADRTLLVGREDSYHGNTIAALDLGGRRRARAPYRDLLGRFFQVPAPAASPDPAWHAARLEEALAEHPRVGAFVAEPIGGAASAAAVPPDGYWEAVVEVCRRHGVLVVADEVMTGFGRTGRWFASDHFGLSPDVMVAGKGAASGYWPLGLCVASGTVADTLGEGRFIHGFTYSHHPVGAAVATTVLDILEREGLVERAEEMGGLLRARLRAAGFDRLRGRGLLVGVEVEGGADDFIAAARGRGLLVYPATESAILLGPPLTITPEEIEELVARMPT